MPWATPTVNGFMKAEANPALAPTRAIPPATSESYPKDLASRSKAGRKTSVSSAMPMLPPPMAKTSVKMTRRSDLFPPRRRTREWMPDWMAPVRFRTPKAPPMTKM